jgi:hypothetical protein
MPSPQPLTLHPHPRATSPFHLSPSPATLESPPSFLNSRIPGPRQFAHCLPPARLAHQTISQSAPKTASPDREATKNLRNNQKLNLARHNYQTSHLQPPIPHPLASVLPSPMTSDWGDDLP